MKKQHSVTDICLSILRGGLCLAVAVSVIKYKIDTSSRDYIVISALPRTTTSAGAAEYTPAVESTAPTETTAKESGAEEPVEIPVSRVSVVTNKSIFDGFTVSLLSLLSAIYYIEKKEKNQVIFCSSFQ